MKKLTKSVLAIVLSSSFALASAQEKKKDSIGETSIDEVVIVGYSKRKASEVVGSTKKLDSDKINNASAQTVESALQGQVAGVQAVNSSGTPGATQDIRIRGIATINASASPLYVIDGVPVQSGNFANSTQNSTFSIMSTINSNDIESMTVLKDASATAQYGARGANGVVLITTKKGRRGNTRYSVDTNLGFQNVAFDKRKSLTGEQRYQLMREQLMNQFQMTDLQAENAIVNNNLAGYNLWVQNGRKNNDWWSVLRNKNATTYSANFSASGGGRGNTFFASLGYNETEALVVSTPFKRMTGKLSYASDLSDKFKLETSLNGSLTTQNPILEGGSYFANPFLTRFLMTPWASPYNEDGTPSTKGVSDFTSLYNPLYLNEHDINQTKILRALSNNKLTFKATKDLSFSQVVNLDYILVDSKTYNNRTHGQYEEQKGSAYRGFNQTFSFASQSMVNYSFDLGRKHKFNATGVFEYIKDNIDNIEGSGKNFPADGLTNLSNVNSNKDTSSAMYDSYNVAYLGVLNYTFNRKLVLDASYRREGSSLFAEGKRFGDFWSLGGAYNLHNDIDSKHINELKIRASYGVTGNANISRNQYQALLSYNADYNNDGGAYPSVYGNENLTWEKQKLADVGLDFSLFGRRLSGSLSYYNKNSYDLLLDVPLSLTTGFSSQLQNVGTVSNQGYEVSLSYDVIDNDNFTWNLFGQVGTVKNEVIELAKDAKGEYINPYAGSSYKTVEIGKAIGTWYLRTWAGVDPDTGAPTWYKNGVSGEVTSNYNEAGRTYHGSPIPKFSGGFGTNLRYKNWNLQSLFSFQGGHKVYEQYAQFYLRTNNFVTSSYNGVQELLDRWQKPGDITNVPKLNWSKDDNFYAASSRHLYDGDFIRLRNVTLSYDMADFLKIKGINSLTLSLSGTNLWTWVKDKGLKLDPEVRADGYTALTTPPVKSVSFGASIKF